MIPKTIQSSVQRDLNESVGGSTMTAVSSTKDFLAINIFFFIGTAQSGDDGSFKTIDR